MGNARHQKRGDAGYGSNKEVAKANSHADGACIPETCRSREILYACSLLKDEAGPKMDQGVAALINDLDQRGMLDSTLVICLGEFGRTPKVNKDAGRDHWPGAMSVLMAGAGIPRGQVVGATDPKGYYAAENIYSPEDFAVSLYTKLGIDPHQILHTNTGRPVQLVNGGKPIKELFA